jgi:CHAT domain-containing protein
MFTHIAAHDADGKGTIGLAAKQKYSLRDLTEFTVGDGKWSDQRPLVFINACGTAVPQQSFTQLTSWAETFFEAGAGGFIGSMWNVRSETASAFARRFYEAIYSEQLSFGQALHKARQHCRSHSDDPTWLAYAAYGTHSATVIRH